MLALDYYWIREWRKSRDKNPNIDDLVKFVQRKLEDYKFSNSDKRIIESMFALLIRTKNNYKL